jgi:crotonobetainyl-CoA:carnitine CoA-transferase CaiB-like acyl-CoA transferase
MTVKTEQRGALSHLRILDFTQFLAGPYATMILGDLGAEVIKVENPAGELARHLPPHFIGDDSLYYMSINRNKKSLAIDLKSPEGKAVVKDIMAQCDVVIENFRPGVMQRLGFDYEEIAKQHPEVIWCSISGFGQHGPYSDLPAYDMIVQALSGGMSLTGEREGASVRAGIPLGDLSAGMYAVIGIMAALLERDRSGKGRLIDISMLDCQVSMLTYLAAYHLFSGEVPGRQGRGHDSIPTYRSFSARDGRDVVITANTEGMWKLLCDAIGMPELTQDKRFITNKDRFRNRHELWPILEKEFKQRTAEEWVTRLREFGVPVGEVKTLDRVLTDPQIIHREMVIDIEDSSGHHIQTAGDPLKFKKGEKYESELRKHRYPPALGQDTASILTELLGKNQNEIAELIEKQVVFPMQKQETKSTPEVVA